MTNSQTTSPKKDKKKVDARKLIVRIVCIFLAFSMVASTLLFVLFYIFS
ncbi:MAG: hypothetical protein ILO53_08850 [Clostridia bacterium]|nr:hypothetical protein [Clostridia bacterium]